MQTKPGYDQAEIDRCAREVAMQMIATRPISVTFTPGNMTRYWLLFVPSLGVVSGDEDAVIDPDECWVAEMTTQVAWRFRLMSPESIHWRYVSEKFSMREGDAKPIAELFAAIQKEMEAM